MRISQPARIPRPRGTFALLKLLVPLLLACSLFVLATRDPHSSDALRSQGPDGLPGVDCSDLTRIDVYLSKSPPVLGDSYFTRTNVKIEGVAQMVYVRYSSNGGCVPYFQDATEVSWELTRPDGSGAVLQGGNQGADRFKRNVVLDTAGTYVVRLTACPNSCLLSFPNSPPVEFAPRSTEVTMIAASELPFPPHFNVSVPDLSSRCNPPGQLFDPCMPTEFSDAHLDWVCAGGGGVVDPQWVTVDQWEGPEDYQLMEGVVERSRVSRVDNPFNHHSQDINFGVSADLPFRYLVARQPEWPEQPYRLGIEWERDSYPEKFRPSLGDRVSVWGYWINDCGHPPFYTEIHPPVAVATHRSRAVHLPLEEGLGSNVWVPGVVSDFFLSNDGGEITDNCSDTGLHQPAAAQGLILGACVPVAGSGGPNPVDGHYNYHIYLPKNPATILAAAGHPNPPPVDLYMKLEGFAGPGISAVSVGRVDTPDGNTYLNVNLNVFPGATPPISGRITAAWKYPAPENWGLQRYSVRLTEIDVNEDGDATCETCGWGGDWRLWMNIQNTEREWTLIKDCDDCVYDGDKLTFDGNPFRTSDTPLVNWLGPHLLRFPEQLIQINMTGFEDDTLYSDDLGTIAILAPQPRSQFRTFVEGNQCTSDATSVAGVELGGRGCGKYFAFIEVAPLGPVTAQLSPEGLAMYEAAKVPAPAMFGCFVILVCFDDLPPLQLVEDIHPNATHPAGPATLYETSAFRQQPIEQLVWTDATPEFLKGILESLPAEKLDLALEEVHDDLMDRPILNQPRWELLMLQSIIPPDKWEQFFSDIDFTIPPWGDINCDNAVTALDALIQLRLGAQLVDHAPCLNIGDVNCDDTYGALDALASLRFNAGLPPVPHAQARLDHGGAGDDTPCREIGSEIILDIEATQITPTPFWTQPPTPVLPPNPTPTPTLTPTPTPTPTPTTTPTGTGGTAIPTPTPTLTPTPTPTPTPVPTPTPDTTGPSITMVTDIPDPIYDTGDQALCALVGTITTISAAINDPSGVNTVRLWYRYFDGVNPPSLFFADAVPSFNGTKWAASFDPPDFPAPTDGNNPARIEWYWEAQDGVGNISTTALSTTTVYDCGSIIT